MAENTGALQSHEESQAEREERLEERARAATGLARLSEGQIRTLQEARSRAQAERVPA